MKDYTEMMEWAVITMIDRNTQDDHRSKIQVAGLFSNPNVAKDSFIPYLPNKEIKIYLIRIEDLERFEDFYNFIQDLNEKFGDYAIYHLHEKYFSVEEENRFRYIFDIWTDTKI